jgi:hypothetical protein
MRVHFPNLLKAFIFFIGLSHSIGGYAQTATPPPGQPVPANPLGVVTPPKIPLEQSAKSREDWRATMSLRPLPKKGCFTSAYPAVDWQEVPCGPPPKRPLLPAKRPRNVGGGGPIQTDFTAQVPPCNPPCHITAAIGSFDSVTGVTSLDGTNNANTFTLQMNTQTTNPTACSGISSCQGWQQFVFSAASECNGPCIFIEYWLLNFGSNCPTTQTQPWQSDGDNDCWFNSPTTSVPTQTIADLGSLIMTAMVGSEDTVNLSTASGLFAVEQDSVLNLHELSASAWLGTEYNIFGDCCGSEVIFNAGSTFVVRLSMLYGSMSPPACVPNSGTTGESNNLNLVSTPPTVPVGLWPSIVFTESNPGNSTPASCVTTVGRAFLPPVVNYLLNQN